MDSKILHSGFEVSSTDSQKLPCLACRPLAWMVWASRYLILVDEKICWKAGVSVASHDSPLLLFSSSIPFHWQLFPPWIPHQTHFVSFLPRAICLKGLSSPRHVNCSPLRDIPSRQIRPAWYKTQSLTFWIQFLDSNSSISHFDKNLLLLDRPNFSIWISIDCTLR